VQFHANHASVSIDGDYYQVLFDAKKDTSGLESPYLLIQRQFEDPDGGVCYVETHDENYIGHFGLRRINLAPSRILLEIDRLRANLVEVTFDMARSDFKRVARVVDIIRGAKEAR
jgi:hypothetical protein